MALEPIPGHEPGNHFDGELFRLIVDSATTALLLCDTDGHVHYANPQAESMFGFGRDALLGTLVEALIPEHHRHAHPSFRAAFLRDGRSRRMGTGRDLFARRLDGGEFPVEIDLNLIDLHGRTLVLCAIADVSARRKAEEALRRQARMLHNSFDPIFTWELDGRIRYWNTGAQHLYGYTAQEARGRHKRELLRTEFPGGFDGLLARLREEGRWEGEVRQSTKDGRTLDVDCRMELVSEPGQPEMVLETAHDNTERRAALARVEAALAEKTVLLDEIHHRVKNNLQVISSLLSLQSARAPQLRAALLESQARIRAMVLIHELLYEKQEFSRLDLAEYVRRLSALLLASLSVPRERVALRLDLQPVMLDLNRAVSCGLLLSELLTNALKHAFPDERRGTLSVALTCEPGGAARLVVADDGVGLPEHPDHDYPRTLGLQLVPLLADQMGARIDTRSGAGTRYTIDFDTGPIRPHGT
ncbi:MAG: sensor histidine kinase [Gammaproteobacteria bacterium]